MLNLILKLPKVYFPWCWSDNKYGSKLLKMFLPKAKELSLTLPWRAEGHEGDGEEVGQLEAWEQISPDWRSCRGRGAELGRQPARGGWCTTWGRGLGAGTRVRLRLGSEVDTAGLGRGQLVAGLGAARGWKRGRTIRASGLWAAFVGTFCATLVALLLLLFSAIW